MALVRRANCDTRRHQPQPVGDIAHSVPAEVQAAEPPFRADGVGRAEACHAAAGDDRGFRLLFEQRFDQHGFLVGTVERLAYHVAAREQTGGVCRNDALGIRFVI